MRNNDKALGQIIRLWDTCHRCEIGNIAYKHVFYRGQMPCHVLMVGEAPGKTEDLDGVPFVGKAGVVLNSWIMAMRDALDKQLRIGITNVVACRPCDKLGGPNRQPLEFEIHNCKERFTQTMHAAKPRAIVALGKIANDYLTERGYMVGRPYCNVYHPAYALRLGGLTSAASAEVVKKLQGFVRAVFG